MMHLSFATILEFAGIATILGYVSCSAVYGQVTTSRALVVGSLGTAIGLLLEISGTAPSGPVIREIPVAATAVGTALALIGTLIWDAAAHYLKTRTTGRIVEMEAS